MAAQHEPDRRAIDRPPPLLLLAAALIGLQAVIAFCLGGFSLITTQAQRPVVGIGSAVVFLAYSGLLGMTSRGLLRLRRWTRGAAVCTQLLHLPIAFSFWPQFWWVSVALVAAAGLILLAVFLPPADQIFAVDR